MNAPDAIERLRDTMAGQTGGGMTCMDADDARAILAHITALTAARETERDRADLAEHLMHHAEAERDAAVAAISARPAIVRIDPDQYEDGLYLNPVTGAVMRVAVHAPVGGK
jgi:hypothetical protein